MTDATKDTYFVIGSFAFWAIFAVLATATWWLGSMPEWYEDLALTTLTFGLAADMHYRVVRYLVTNKTAKRDE